MTENKKEDKVDLPEALTPDQEEAVDDGAELQKQIEEKSARLAEILKEEPAMAIQPFMNISQFGIKPDVALVPVPEKETEQPTQSQDVDPKQDK